MLTSLEQEKCSAMVAGLLSYILQHAQLLHWLLLGFSPSLSMTLFHIVATLELVPSREKTEVTGAL